MTDTSPDQKAIEQSPSGSEATQGSGEGLVRKGVSSERIVGYDHLRCVALLCVLCSHILSVLGREDLTIFAGVALGQIGVAIFLAISGALVANEKRPPGDWLIARLKKILPAYWVVTVLGFLVTILSGYKSVSLLQFLWQMSGFGLTFLREDLVNVATWFISLLLTLYFLVFLARLTKYPRWILSGVWLFCLGMVLLDCEGHYYSRCLVFLTSLLVFQTPHPIRNGMLFATLSFAGSIPLREFLYPCVGVLAVLSVQAIRNRPRWIGLMAQYSYEFYLCHGIFLVGGVKLLKRAPPIGCFVGVLASIALAVVIQHGIEWLRTQNQHRLSKKLGRNSEGT